MRIITNITRIAFLTGALLILANCGPGFKSKSGDIFIVGDAIQLNAALEAAEGGDTILLEPGDYGDFRISDKEFDEEVTVVSSEKHESNFDSIEVEESSNIEIKDVRIETDEERSKEPLEIRNSDNIRVENVRIEDGKESIVNGEDGDLEWRDEDGQEEREDEESSEDWEERWGDERIGENDEKEGERADEHDEGEESVERLN